MRRLFLRLFLLTFFCAMSHRSNGEELRPQFRAWKSSALQGGNYSNVLLSTTPILFHCVNGSGTVNVGGNSYFVVLRSTGNNNVSAPTFIPQVSTKAFIPLDNGTAYSDKIGVGYDVFSDCQTFFSKQGGAIINYEYDFYKLDPWNPFNRD